MYFNRTTPYDKILYKSKAIDDGVLRLDKVSEVFWRNTMGKYKCEKRVGIGTVGD